MRPCADRAHVNGSLDEQPDKHETLLIPGKCFGILLCPQLNDPDSYSRKSIHFVSQCKLYASLRGQRQTMDIPISLIHEQSTLLFEFLPAGDIIPLVWGKRMHLGFLHAFRPYVLTSIGGTSLHYIYRLLYRAARSYLPSSWWIRKTKDMQLPKPLHVTYIETMEWF